MQEEESVRFPYLARYKKSIITLLIFVTYAGAVFWGNYTSMQRLQDNALTQFKLETEKQASAISYFFSERRSDISELAESDTIGSFFANRDLGMTYEYGLGLNVQVIEDRLEQVATRKRIGGDFSRMKIGADDTLGRTGFLDLGDHGRLPGGDFATNGADEIARRRLRFGFGADVGQRLDRQRCGNFLTFDGEDLVQDVTHGFPLLLHSLRR